RGRRGNFGSQRRPVSKHAGDKYAWRTARNARVRAVTPEKQSAAGDQCLERRRSTDRRRGWLGASLLHFEDCAEWRDSAAFSGVAEIRREFSVPWLGADGNGRRKREPLSGGRRGHDCVARQRSAAGS